MVNKETNCHHDSFFSGFILGALFGGLLVFTLSTKEGKEKAKKFLKKGEELLEEWEEKMPELKEYWEEKQDSVNRLGKRFFSKNGRKLGLDKA